MGRQETTLAVAAVKGAAGALRRVILALAVAALMAALTVAMASEPAFAKGGCKDFGQGVNGAAREDRPFGQTTISGSAQDGGAGPEIRVAQARACN